MFLLLLFLSRRVVTFQPRKLPLFFCDSHPEPSKSRVKCSIRLYLFTPHSSPPLLHIYTFPRFFASSRPDRSRNKSGLLRDSCHVRSCSLYFRVPERSDDPTRWREAVWTFGCCCHTESTREGLQAHLGVTSLQLQLHQLWVRVRAHAELVIRQFYTLQPL